MQSKAVLVVDDDEMNRILLDTILRHEGFEVVLVNGGAEAIERLQVQEFSAILLDMLMPTVNGFDVIQFMIKTDPRLLEKVVVVTALGDKFVANFDPTLVHGFIRKPFNRQDLVKIVRTCVVEKSRKRDPDSTLT